MADLDRDGVPDIAIGDLTPAHTEPFYRQNYWMPARCDLIASLSPALSIAVFDAAVHHGPKRAIQQLQQVLGGMADGRLGPVSIGRLKQQLGAKGEGQSLLALMMQRASFMHGIVRKDPSQWANADGWINRLLRLQSYLLSDVVGEVVA
ncbi:Secretion activator protein [Aeromonas veronii B565]|nr:Secretion activator protein [Aeromonas veronii B565]